MQRKLIRLLFLSIFSLFVSLMLLSAGKPAMAGDEAGIKIMDKESVGKYLAGGNGMTLYRYTRDEKNISNCIEGCALNWPPFYVDPAAGVEGCDASDFAVIKRTDGSKQTTYKGMPLYYFKNDKYPGDTFGNGLGSVWFLVSP